MRILRHMPRFYCRGNHRLLILSSQFAFPVHHGQTSAKQRFPGVFWCLLHIRERRSIREIRSPPFPLACSTTAVDTPIYWQAQVRSHFTDRDEYHLIQ